MFVAPTLSNSDDAYEDLKPFCIEHEMTENYEGLKDRIYQKDDIVAGLNNQHDEIARRTHLVRAHEAGLLDKMLEFHILIQITVQHRLED